ncbi:MAG TPA: DUF6051 family protein [Williamwhitmania sp.]|nr:DUF6051 family protein [Williamwhitmania sp.]
MDYTTLFNQLKTLPNCCDKKVVFPDSEHVVEWKQFSSPWRLNGGPKNDAMSQISRLLTQNSDNQISENQTFSYPMVFPNENRSFNRAIIMLHGLNERSWQKYWAWAVYLAKTNNVPVILFPISFHMNRAPQSWANARAMLPLLTKAKSLLPFIDNMTTYLNFALSVRLTEEPLRFFTSGHQSALDIVHLTEQLSLGHIAPFEKNTKVDIFAYSIGAFLAQVLLVANPYGLFNDSRFFLFCGGALFEDMQGTSKHILGKSAFARLSSYYLTEFEAEVRRETPLSKFILKDEMGQAFYAMLSANRNREMREMAFEKAADRLYAIGLKQDTVISSIGIQKAIGLRTNRKPRFEELDFPFPYTHEMPFPLASKGVSSSTLNGSFNQIFTKASAFLA